MTQTALTREQLYQQVWAEPMTIVARRFGLSDRGLAKLCARHRIPVPGRGHWARKAHGKRVTQHPLPAATNPQPIQIVISTGATDQKSAGPVDFERRPENRVVVDQCAELQHSLAQRTSAMLMTAKTNPDGVVPPADGCLNVRVAPATRSRALHIMDAILRALERRGHLPEILDGKTGVTLHDERMEFCLHEQLRSIPHAITKAERLERAKNPWAQIPAFDHEPNGTLVLEITNTDSSGVRRRWTDGERQRVEDRLNAFMAALDKASVIKHTKRLERERWQREWHEQQQRERLERERRTQLTNWVDRWHEAERIREFLNAARAHLAQGIPPETLAFLEWAERHVQLLDPLDPRIE